MRTTTCAAPWISGRVACGTFELRRWVGFFGFVTKAALVGPTTARCRVPLARFGANSSPCFGCLDLPALFVSLFMCPRIDEVRSHVRRLGPLEIDSVRGYLPDLWLGRYRVRS